MKSKNLVIACVWTFVLVIVGGYVSAGILWTDYRTLSEVFNVGLLLFFIALIFTGVIMYSIPESTNGETELKLIRSKLDELASEVEEMKKTLD